PIIPIEKPYEGRKLTRALEAMTRANVRVSDLVMGDFHAQIAGGAVGGDRLLEFMEEFGFARLEPLADEIVTRTERAMREAIGRLKPGRYEYAITSDGYDEPLTIACRCEIAGDSLWIDFAGSSPASRRGVNVVMNYTEAYTIYGVKVIVSPDVPNNEGAFRVLRITAPEGSILNVQHPAPVAARHVVGHFIPHVVAGALKQALPDHVMAEGSANIWGIQLSGKDKERKPFVYTFFGSGGTGARPTKDGLSATACPSGVLGTPVEVVETLAPLLVARKALRDGSGGDGRFRGGLGQALAFRVLTDDPATCSVFCDRTVVPAQGFFGGQPGAKGALLINGKAPANPKAEQLIQPGDLIELLVPG